MKTITSTDLKNWAFTRDSQQYLPSLLRRLIINHIGFDNIKYIVISGGDSIWKPGVDGKILTSVDSILGEKDKTYMVECGQSKDGVQKFKDDLAKRTKELNGVKQKNSVFVFVTTLRVEHPDQVLQKVKKSVPDSHLWADIKLFDADNIETWLDHDFATFAWLADLMGKPTNGLKDFNYHWKEWINSTEIPIDEDIILARSNNYQDEIDNFLRSESGVFHIKSASRKESLLFFMSAVQKSSFKEDKIDAIKSKIVTVQNVDTWNRLVEYKESKKLILVPLFGIPENLGYLVNDGFQIFIPMSENDGMGTEPNMVYIEPFNVDILYSVLETKLNSYEKTNRVIKKLGHSGSLLHLQRLLERKDVSHPAPIWATRDNWEFLLLAAMVGSWCGSNNQDRIFISKVFGKSYEEIEKKLSFHIKTEEAPIKRIGDKWEICFPELIIDYLGGYMTKEFFEKYLSETKVVLSKVNSKYNSTGINRLMVSYDYKTMENTYYSEQLVYGIARGYAAIANYENRFAYLSDVKAKIQRNIADVLSEKDWKLWATLNRVMPLLAEAGQEVFINIINNILDTQSQLIKDLYTKGENNGFLGECLYSGLLWGLEALAWFDTYFVQVTNILVKMDKLKTMDLRYGNSAFDSLNRIFCSWSSNTLVSLGKRRDCIMHLLKDNKYDDVMFRLLYSLLPTNRMITQPTNRPEFIELEDPGAPISSAVWQFNNFVFDCTLNLLDETKERWDKITRYITFMDLDWFNKFVTKISGINWDAVDNDFKKSVYQNLIYWMDFSKKFTEGDKWFVDEKSKKISKIIQIINLDNPIDKNIQLFSRRCVWDYKNMNDEKSPELQKAIQDIIDSNGIEGLIDFAKQIEAVEVFGQEVGLMGLELSDATELLNSPDKNNSSVARFLSIFFAVQVNIGGIDFIKATFKDSWSLDYKRLLICAVKGNEEFWKWLEGKDLEEYYWQNRFNVFPTTDTEYEFIVNKLKQYNNYMALITLFCMQLHQNKKYRVKTEDVIDALIKPINNNEETLNNMDQYHIQRLLEFLQKQPDTDDQTMFQLEIMYFDLFDEYHGLQPIYIYKKLRSDPAFFVEILSLMFLKTSDLENKTEQEQKWLKNAATIANKLDFRLEKSYIFSNKEEVETWIKQVTDLLDNLGDRELARLGVRKIGAMLANCPVDPNDGVWPVQYIRDVLEEICNQDIIAGINIAKHNALGFHYVDRANPGKYWEEKAIKCKEDARQLRFKYPKTSELLEILAKSFYRDAQYDKTDLI